MNVTVCVPFDVDICETIHESIVIIMKSNLHPIDRIVRLVIALTIAILIFTNVIAGSLAWITGIPAIIFGGTALINFCPLYHLLGISTKDKNQ